MNYYIESSQEPGFEENEFIYEDLDLEEISKPKSFCSEVYMLLLKLVGEF